MFTTHETTTDITNPILNEDCPTVKAPHRAKFMSVAGINLTSKLNSIMFNTGQNLDLEPIPQSLFPNTTEAHPYLFTGGPDKGCTVASRNVNVPSHRGFGRHWDNKQLDTAIPYREGHNKRDN